jgi:hypothetical protein
VEEVTAAVLSFLVAEGRAWVESQRRRYREECESLPSRIHEALRGFFGSATLDRIGLCVVRSIENPPFYHGLARAGGAIPFDFGRLPAITFIDTILVAEDAATGGGLPGLVFHESVHVVQYDLLGVEGFIHRYVHGWASGGFRYSSIPLEAQAYELQSRFERDPADVFAVEEEVRDLFSGPAGDPSRVGEGAKSDD